jgi:glycerophosphoryl diester phosphodiesterase
MNAPVRREARVYSGGRAVTIPLTSIFARPSVIAHRGASKEAPENTLPAFAAAVRARADLVELDVHLTADGVPVVVHDADLTRTTDRTGLVGELTAAEVRAADASRGLGEPTPVPTLDEVLALLDGSGTGVDVELKNLPGQPGYDSPREALLDAVLEVLERAAFRGAVLLTSFNPLTLLRARELAPHLPTGILSVDAIDPLEALEAGHAAVLPSARALDRAGAGFVEEAHGSAVAVATWTVDDEPTLERLFSWGVDAVASNDPATAVRVRDRVVGPG